MADKWEHELEYRLTKQLWAFGDNRIAVRFQYEYRNAAGQWFRAYGNENWEFDGEGLGNKKVSGKQKGVRETKRCQGNKKVSGKQKGVRETKRCQKQKGVRNKKVSETKRCQEPFW